MSLSKDPKALYEDDDDLENMFLDNDQKIKNGTITQRDTIRYGTDNINKEKNPFTLS